MQSNSTSDDSQKFGMGMWGGVGGSSTEINDKQIATVPEQFVLCALKYNHVSSSVIFSVFNSFFKRQTLTDNRSTSVFLFGVFSQSTCPTSLDKLPPKLMCS